MQPERPDKHNPLALLHFTELAFNTLWVRALCLMRTPANHQSSHAPFQQSCLLLTARKVTWSLTAEAAILLRLTLTGDVIRQYLDGLFLQY